MLIGDNMKLSDLLVNRELRNFSLRKTDTFSIRPRTQLSRKYFDYLAETEWLKRKQFLDSGYFRPLSKEQFLSEIAPYLDRLYDEYRSKAEIPSTDSGEAVLINMLSRSVGQMAFLTLWNGQQDFNREAELNEAVDTFATQITNSTRPKPVDQIVEEGLEWALNEGADVIGHLFYDVEEFWGSKFEYNLPREMAKFSDQIREAGRKICTSKPWSASGRYLG